MMCFGQEAEVQTQLASMKEYISLVLVGSFLQESYIIYLLLEIDVDEPTIGVRQFTLSLGLTNILLWVLYACINFFNLFEELILLFSGILHSIWSWLTHFSSCLHQYIWWCVVCIAILFVVLYDFHESFYIVDDVFAIFRYFHL